MPSSTTVLHISSPPPLLYFACMYKILAPGRHAPPATLFYVSAHNLASYSRRILSISSLSSPLQSIMSSDMAEKLAN